MLFGLLTRSDIDISIIKDRGVPFVQLASGDIRNAYTLKIANKQRSERILDLRIEDMPGATVEIIGEGDAAGRAQVTAEPDGIDRYRVLVTAPAAAVSPGGSMIRFNLSDATGASSVATQFDGPES
jgi:polyferredoxin